MPRSDLFIALLAGLIALDARAAGPPDDERPSVVFDATPVAYAQRSKVREFVVRLNFRRKPRTAPSVEMTLDVGRGEPRTFAAIPVESGSAYSVMAPLVPEYLHPERLHIAARFSAGSVQSSVEDTELDLHGRTIMLREIRRYEAGQPLRLVLASGEVLHELPNGLQNMRADLGPVALTLNLARAEEFSVEPASANPDAVGYRIQVKEANRVVAEQAGIIRVTGSPSTEPVDKGAAASSTK